MWLAIIVAVFSLGAPWGPLDLGPLADGLGAIATNPASLGKTDHPGIQLRLGRAKDWAVGATAQIPYLPFVEVEWDSATYQSYGVGYALGIGPVALGAAYRWAPGKGGGLALGGFVEPASWLRLSSRLALSMGAPGTLSLGAGIRPVGGARWLELGVEGDWSPALGSIEYMLVGQATPWSGLRVHAGYDAQTRSGLVGVSVALEHVQWAGGIAGNMRAPALAQLFTLTTGRQENLLAPHGQSVRVDLHGTLRRTHGGILSGDEELVSTAAFRLHELASDEHVARVVLGLGDLEVGLATVEEVRRGILALRLARKKVVAELLFADEKTYMLAAVCDEVLIDPLGTIVLDGFAVRLMFFAEGLEKAGIKVESVEIGRYKSAPDVFTRDAPRPEELEVQEEILALAHARLLRALEDRKLSQDRIETVLAQAMFTAQTAKDAGLVDGFTEALEVGAPRPRREALPGWDGLPEQRAAWGARPRIEVVPISGVIGVDDALPFLGPGAKAQEIITQLDFAEADSSVLGVVLRVDSPGGDIMASELIWRAVRRLSARKPVIAALSDVAASGGYYVATAASRIIAEPTTITGSIGVFAYKANVQGLTDILGIHSHVLKSGPHAGWDSPFSALTDEARERLKARLSAYYDDFVARVAQGRKISVAQAEELAQGRIYTGARARELGLVDAEGGLWDAVAWLRQELHRDFLAVHFHTKATGLTSELLAQNGATVTGWLTRQARALSTLVNRPLALMPVWPVLHEGL